MWAFLGCCIGSSSSPQHLPLIITRMIALRYTIPYHSIKTFFFVYAHADILINSLVYTNRCTQEKLLRVHPMEGHLYKTLIFRAIVMIASNIKNRCLAWGNHFVNVPNVLTQSNTEIVLKGICFSISQTTFFPPSPFTPFFLFRRRVPTFFIVTNYIRTFLQAFLDRKHFPRMEKLLNHHHHRRRCNTSYV